MQSLTVRLLLISKFISSSALTLISSLTLRARSLLNEQSRKKSEISSDAGTHKKGGFQNNDILVNAPRICLLHAHHHHPHPRPQSSTQFHQNDARIHSLPHFLVFHFDDDIVGSLSSSSEWTLGVEAREYTHSHDAGGRIEMRWAAAVVLTACRKGWENIIMNIHTSHIWATNVCVRYPFKEWKVS